MKRLSRNSITRECNRGLNAWFLLTIACAVFGGTSAAFSAEVPMKTPAKSPTPVPLQVDRKIGLRLGTAAGWTHETETGRLTNTERLVYLPEVGLDFDFKPNRRMHLFRAALDLVLPQTSSGQQPPVGGRVLFRGAYALGPEERATAVSVLFDTKWEMLGHLSANSSNLLTTRKRSQFSVRTGALIEPLPDYRLRAEPTIGAILLGSVDAGPSFLPTHSFSGIEFGLLMGIPIVDSFEGQVYYQGDSIRSSNSEFKLNSQRLGVQFRLEI